MLGGKTTTSAEHMVLAHGADGQVSALGHMLDSLDPALLDEPDVRRGVAFQEDGLALGIAFFAQTFLEPRKLAGWDAFEDVEGRNERFGEGARRVGTPLG